MPCDDLKMITHLQKLLQVNPARLGRLFQYRDNLLCISQLKPRTPRPPGHSGEFNIYTVLKDVLFPRPRGQEAC